MPRNHIALSGMVVGLVLGAAPADSDVCGDSGACCYSDGECRVLPAERCATLVGDVNCDDDVDLADVNPFVNLLSGGSAPDCAWANADCNRDGALNFSDINPFVMVLVQDSRLTGAFLGPGTDCDPNPCVLPGDTCANAKIITGEPYTDLGSTCGYTDDYDESCPFNQPGAPDVVYRYAPAWDTVVDITLCLTETDYDTKLYVYEGECPGNLIACNDDACSTASHPAAFVSKLSWVFLQAGHTYYIVVDGYGGACGTYELLLIPPPPCVVPCPPGALDEGEPCGTDTNGGCGLNPPAYGLISDGQTVCGTSYYDGNLRDTDWYRIEVEPGDPVLYGITVQAEFDVQVMFIRDDGEDCTGLEIYYAEGAPCQEVFLATPPAPTSIDYIWIAPQFTTPFACDDEHSHYWVNAVFYAFDPPPGACCIDGVCHDYLTIWECADQGGTWMGYEVPCTPELCQPAAPQ